MRSIAFPDEPLGDYQPTMPALVARAAAVFGDEVFLVDQGQRLTFAELERRSLRLATEFVRCGLGKGSRVAALLPSGADWVVTWAACGRIGALFMPLSTLYTPAERKRILRLGDVRTLVVPQTLFGRGIRECVEEFPIPPSWESEVSRDAPTLLDALVIDELPFLRSVLILGDFAPVARGEAGQNPEAPPKEGGCVVQMANHIVPADELVTIFTSGTTAQAKAVVHSHGSVFRKTHPTRYLPGVPQGRGPTFVGMPFFWVGGLSILGRALQAGSTLLCQEKFDLESAVALMEEEHVAEVIAWPTTIARLRSHPRVRHGSLASVAALAPPSIERELTHNSLGMTETMGPHTGGPRPDAPPEETIVPLPERLRGSWGAPLEGMQHRVVDRESGETISDDTVGEICVRGSSMMTRLYKKERFEMFDADGWYHTGDEGSLRDGYLFFKGRIGDMIKVRGANVAPREVEVALEKAADVSTAVVVGLPDPMEGEQVVALITAKSADVDLVQLREALRSQLSPYKIPSTIVVWPDELPTLPSGKPDRNAVRQILSES